MKPTDNKQYQKAADQLYVQSFSVTDTQKKSTLLEQSFKLYLRVLENSPSDNCINFKLAIITYHLENYLLSKGYIYWVLKNQSMDLSLVFLFLGHLFYKLEEKNKSKLFFKLALNPDYYEHQDLMLFFDAEDHVVGTSHLVRNKAELLNPGLCLLDNRPQISFPEIEVDEIIQTIDPPCYLKEDQLSKLYHVIMTHDIKVCDAPRIELLSHYFHTKGIEITKHFASIILKSSPTQEEEQCIRDLLSE